eukprot:gene8037-16473_t
MGGGNSKNSEVGLAQSKYETRDVESYQHASRRRRKSSITDALRVLSGDRNGQIEEYIDSIILPYYVKNVELTKDDIDHSARVWRLLMSFDNTTPYLERKSKDPETFTYASTLTWFYDQFYKKFFELCPEAAIFFVHVTLTAQGRLIGGLITSALDSFKARERIKARLERLANAHNQTGIKPIHYCYMGEALLWALELVVGDPFDNNAKLSWGRLYSYLLNIMLPIAITHELKEMEKSTRERRFSMVKRFMSRDFTFDILKPLDFMVLNDPNKAIIEQAIMVYRIPSKDNIDPVRGIKGREESIEIHNNNNNDDNLNNNINNNALDTMTILNSKPNQNMTNGILPITKLSKYETESGCPMMHQHQHNNNTNNNHNYQSQDEVQVEVQDDDEANDISMCPFSSNCNKPSGNKQQLYKKEVESKCPFSKDSRSLGSGFVIWDGYLERKGCSLKNISYLRGRSVRAHCWAIEIDQVVGRWLDCRVYGWVEGDGSSITFVRLLSFDGGIFCVEERLVGLGHERDLDFAGNIASRLASTS